MLPMHSEMGVTLMIPDDASTLVLEGPAPLMSDECLTSNCCALLCYGEKVSDRCVSHSVISVSARCWELTGL